MGDSFDIKLPFSYICKS